MIELTRLNGHKIAVNCDLIRYAESSPDTVLTLVTGEKLIVRETSVEVTELAFEHRAALLRRAWPNAASALAVRCAHDVVHDAARTAAHNDPHPFFERR